MMEFFWHDSLARKFSWLDFREALDVILMILLA